MHPLCPPKLEVYNDELYVVAQTAELVGDRSATARWRSSPVTITLSPCGTAMPERWANFGSNFEASPTQFGKGVDYVLHAILHRVVDQYLPIFEMIEDDVLAMERRSLHDFLGPEEVARIFELRSELTRFQRTLGAMAELVREARSRPLSLHQRRNDTIFPRRRGPCPPRAVHGRRPPACPVHGLRGQQPSGSAGIGVVTRQLAAWAAILTVPTAIAGIYGMNFSTCRNWTRHMATSSCSE